MMGNTPTRCLVFSLLLATGCGQRQQTVLGQTPDGVVRTVASVLGPDARGHVVVRGVMVEKCPVAGCWLRVQDGTGSIKVDTKSAGFVVVDVPLRREVTVAGTVVIRGQEHMLEARGLRY